MAEVRNNLTRRITQREGGSGTLESNAEMVDPAIFADAAGGDLHLGDLDGEPHTAGTPDLGADER